MNGSSNLNSLPYNYSDNSINNFNFSSNDPLSFLSEDPLDFLSDDSASFMHFVDEGQMSSGQEIKILDIKVLNTKQNPEKAAALANAGFAVIVKENNKKTEVSFDPRISDKFKNIKQINIKDINNVTRTLNKGEFTTREQTRQEMFYIANRINTIAQNIFNQKIAEKNSNQEDKETLTLPLSPTYTYSYQESKLKKSINQISEDNTQLTNINKITKQIKTVQNQADRINEKKANEKLEKETEQKLEIIKEEVENTEKINQAKKHDNIFISLNNNDIDHKIIKDSLNKNYLFFKI